MFSYILPDKRGPQDDPLRMIRSLVDGVLEQLSPRFHKLYARAWVAVDRAREAAAGVVAADAVLGEKRAAAITPVCEPRGTKWRAEEDRDLE